MQYVNDIRTERETPTSIDECLHTDESRYDVIIQLARSARKIQKMRVREAEKLIRDFGDDAKVPRYKDGPAISAMKVMAS